MGKPDILIGDGIAHRFPDRDHLAVFYQDLQLPVYVAVEADSLKAEFAFARICGPGRSAPYIHGRTVKEDIPFLYAAIVIQFFSEAVVNKPPVIRWKRFALLLFSHAGRFPLSRGQRLCQFLRLPVRQVSLYVLRIGWGRVRRYISVHIKIVQIFRIPVIPVFLRKIVLPLLLKQLLTAFGICQKKGGRLIGRRSRYPTRLRFTDQDDDN